MVPIRTIAIILLLVAFGLLVPPLPGLALFKRFGTRTKVVLGSIGVAVAVVAIALSKR